MPQKYDFANPEPLWSKYFRFTGRLNRLPFFLRYLVLFIITLVSNFISGFMGKALEMGQVGGLIFVFGLLGMLIILVIALANAVATIALIIRRLHDVNITGLLVIPVIVVDLFIFVFQESLIGLILNIILLGIIVILCLYPRVRGHNKYGLDPLGYEDDYIDAVFGENDGNKYYQKQLPDAGPADPVREPPRIRNTSPAGAKGTWLAVTRKPSR